MTPVDAIPVNDDTRPSAQVVHFTRWCLERNRRRENERDRQRQPRQPEPPEAA